MEEKIIQMLKNGLPASVVATAVGVDPSFIAALLENPTIAAEVTAAKVAVVEQAVRKDTKVEDLEEKALNRLEQLLPFISKPMEAARIFQTLNEAKRKTPEETGVAAPTATVVQLNVSLQSAIAFKLSPDQQVVEVDGRSMTTLPARVLQEKLKQKQDSRPAITDATSAAQLLDRIEQGIPKMTIAHVL